MRLIWRQHFWIITIRKSYADVVLDDTYTYPLIFQKHLPITSKNNSLNFIYDLNINHSGKNHKRLVMKREMRRVFFFFLLLWKIKKRQLKPEELKKSRMWLRNSNLSKVVSYSIRSLPYQHSTWTIFRDQFLVKRFMVSCIMAACLCGGGNQ